MVPYGGHFVCMHFSVCKGLGVAKRYCRIKVIGDTFMQMLIGYARVSTSTRYAVASFCPRLKARNFSRQITEIRIGQNVLNIMTGLGHPVFEHIS